MKNNSPTRSQSLGDILIVDDNTFNLKLLQEILTKAGYQVRPASDGELALRSVQAKVPDLILLDIKMPGMDGIEVCRRLKADPETRDIPVIFLSALRDVEMKVKALKEGGVDYVTKPIEPSEVLARIETHLHSYRLQKELADQSEELVKEIEERRRAEDALQKAHNQLEERVEERTAELVKANEALLQSKEELQRYITAIDDIGLGMCVIDENHRVRVMNNTLIEWFGDQRGNYCYKAIMGQDTPCSVCKLNKVVEQKKTIHYQPIKSKDRIFEIVATAISNSDGAISNMEIIRDITEQKEREQQKLATTRQQEELKRLESLKTMASAIAHRFNNSMMAVMGNLELITLTLPVDSEEYQLAKNGNQAARGASQLGAMMLSYVGQNPLQLKELSLADVVQESVTTLQGSFNPLISLKFTPPDQPLYCRMDQQQMQEVIESILTNAVESMGDDSGSIEIAFGTEYYTTDSFPVSFQNDELKDGNYTFCRITDSGHGIKPEDLPRIFEPFYTTRFIGRGLGLALTVGIMQTHHGAIIVDSAPGTGTTIRILLPTIPSPQQAKKTLERGKDEVMQLSGDILIADDAPLVLDVSRKMFGKLGFTVHTAVDAQEAIELISGSNIEFCAVILDVSMPGMDSIEAMKAIRKIDPVVPIVLSSSYAEDDYSFDDDREIKPNGFLRKPMRLSDIRSRLEKVLGC